MATWKKSRTIDVGVIAEDRSDVEVVGALLDKYLAPNSYTIKKFVGDGCGRLKNKCRTWTDTLLKSGCRHVLIIHDLDRNDEVQLRDFLETKVPPQEFPNSVVIIPVEELEAWLLADEAAISAVFTLKQKLKRVSNPERVISPKEEIERLVWKASQKRYVNTIHNVKIAARATLDNIRRCNSFIAFDDYVSNNILGKAKRSRARKVRVR
jgi:hypothetical protein